MLRDVQHVAQNFIFLLGWASLIAAPPVLLSWFTGLTGWGYVGAFAAWVAFIGLSFYDFDR